MIDVVIVAKNEQRHLGAVLTALTAQEDLAEAVKVFVVDNGSTDDTISIAQAHGACVIQCAGSLGRARNAGIAYGAGELVAFLDAHSLPCSNWATSLAEAFEKNPVLGAAMGSIENISERPGTDLFAKSSIFSSPERLWRNTISGLNSPLPWIPTGNCMYSRKALEDVDGFNQSLFRCEDTDLSWKVVLNGYQLLYVPEARVTHYDQAGATSYLRKYYNYGAGAAELANLYGLQPRTEKNQNLRGTKLVLDLCYKLGFRTNANANSIRRQPPQVAQKFRLPFKWNDQTQLGLSRSAVFWTVDDRTYICVELSNNTRLVLEDTSSLIFKLLTKGVDRIKIIENVCQTYDIGEANAAADVDEFVQHLLDEKLLISHSIVPVKTNSRKEPTEV
ncbi:MAG: glycosyltransferase [Candidatus Melainabacteria bacterium]|nr:glycosyltransferase [Candidatus Melainabacteria bacterium]